MSGHGFSGALCIEGKIVVAANLERLTRIKYDICLPISRTDLQTFGWNADPQTYTENLDLPFDLESDYENIDFARNDKFQMLIHNLLSSGGIELKDVDCVVYSYRHVKSAECFFKQSNPDIEFIVPEHHFAHSCQAFMASPFESAAILILDGQGVPLERAGNDQLSGCLAYGEGNKIRIITDLPVRYSLGDMYAAITHLCGFKTNEEGKTMGLAPYGSPQYYEDMRTGIKLNTRRYGINDLKSLARGQFRPSHNLFSLGDYRKYLKRFQRRNPSQNIESTHKNLAYAGQKIIEDVMIYLADWLQKKTGSSNLCMAGGVALNCVANYKVLQNTGYEHIFIHPNAGDNGLAVGQALYAYNLSGGKPRVYQAHNDYLGKSYSEKAVEQAVGRLANENGIDVLQHREMDSLYNTVAQAIENGRIVGWWQGRSEFGPRALGNRSILADPRRHDMKDILNARVKFRESFRPFTPSALAERATEYFDMDVDSPFMLLAPSVKSGKGELIPAVTHVDGTARLQTVTERENRHYYRLIRAFEKRTEIPMVLNTSFNIAGEPIVETPEDALNCFKNTEIDLLGIGDYIISKASCK